MRLFGRFRLFLVQLAFWAAVAVPAHAQTFEAGLLNCGPLATEVTHRVRCLSMPGSLVVGASGQHRRVVFGATLAFTTLAVTRCNPQPCESTGRDYRPHRTEPIETERDAVILTPRVGYRLAFMEAGLALPILQTAYSLVGASPMLVVAPYAGVEARRGVVGLFARVYAIPPQGARWTAFSEATGYKRVAEAWPNGKNDPLWLLPFEAGARLVMR